MSRQPLDASVDVSGYAFGAILADRWLVFQREIREIRFLRNTEIRLENMRNTKLGCTIANVVSRGFRGYRTLWGSGRPTLRNIASTSGAIWGKYTFTKYRNTTWKYEKYKNGGAPSQTSCPEVSVVIGHYGVQPCTVSRRQVVRFWGSWQCRYVDKWKI